MDLLEQWPAPFKIVATNSLETVTFDYKIAYNAFSDRTNAQYASNNFSPPGKFKPRFAIRMEPNVSGYVQVHLMLQSSDKPVMVTTNTSVLNKQGNKQRNATYTFELNKAVDGKKSYKIFSILRTDLENTSNELLQENKLTIFCELSVQLEHNKIENDKVAIEMLETFDDKQKFVDDLEKMFESQKFCDVTFVVGDAKFMAMKSILSARSAVFKGLFDQNTKRKGSEDKNQKKIIEEKKHEKKPEKKPEKIKEKKQKEREVKKTEKELPKKEENKKSKKENEMKIETYNEEDEEEDKEDEEDEDEKFEKDDETDETDEDEEDEKTDETDEEKNKEKEVEKQEEKVITEFEIKDIDANVFKQILRYIYTSKIPLVNENIEGFLYASNKYKLEWLKQICEEELCNQLSIEKMYYTLLLADETNSNVLKNKTLEFIKTHDSVQVFIKYLAERPSDNKRLIDLMVDIRDMTPELTKS